MHRHTFTKLSSNTWVELGSVPWMNSTATLTTPTANPTLVEADTIQLSMSGGIGSGTNSNVTLIVAAAPNNTVSSVSTRH